MNIVQDNAKIVGKVVMVPESGDRNSLSNQATIKKIDYGYLRQDFNSAKSDKAIMIDKDVTDSKNTDQVQMYKGDENQQTMQQLTDDIDKMLQEKANDIVTSKLSQFLQIKQQEHQQNSNNKLTQFVHDQNDQVQNKKVFLNKYGNEHQEFFSFYVNDAKLYPNPNGKREQIVQVIKWIVPLKNETRNLKIYGSDGTYKTDMVFSKFLKQYGMENYNPENCVIRLLERDKDNTRFLNPQDFVLTNAKKVSISFSPDGKWIAVFRLGRNILKIYKIKENGGYYDLKETLEHIQDESYPADISFNDDDQEKLRQNQLMAFDVGIDSHFLACYGKSKVFIIKLLNIDKIGQFECQYEIQQSYDHIINVKLVSQNESLFKCFASCKIKNQKNIEFLDIGNESQIEAHTRIITYLNESNNLQTEMTNDFKQMMLTTGFNVFILKEGKAGEYTQAVIRWLRDQEINKTLVLQDEFIFVYHSLFSKNMHLRSSKNINFHFKVPKNVEPNSLKVMDFRQDTTIIDKATGLGTLMCIINFIDETMYYDVINPQIDTSSRELAEAKSKYIVSNRQYTPNGMHTAEYPWIVSQGDRQFLQIHNAYQRNEVRSVMLGQDCMKVNQDWEGGDEMCEFELQYMKITKKYELFILIKNVTRSKFELYVILLKSEKYDLKFVMSYDPPQRPTNAENAQPGYDMVLDIWIRSQSEEGDDDQNNLFFVFFLHRYGLKWWMSGTPNTVTHLCYTTDSKLLGLTPNLFSFRDDLKVGKKKILRLRQCSIRYSSFATSDIFSDVEGIDKISQYVVDTHETSIIMLCKRDNATFYLKIYHLLKGKWLLEGLEIKDQQILGRLRSNLFSILGGYMYFHNDVYKVRFDLLDQPGVLDLKEKDFFNLQTNILPLQDNELIRANSPMFNKQYHRQIYLTRNPEAEMPNRILMLPYLHERQVFLNRMQKNRKYFYTAIKNTQAVIDESKKGSEKTLFCIDFTKKIYKTYTDGGIFLNSINFNENQIIEEINQTLDFDYPLSVSNDGQFYLFKQKHDPLMVYIMQLTCTKFVFVKSINIRNGIQYYKTHCGDKKEVLTPKQLARANAFLGDDYKQRIKYMDEEEKKNEVDFEKDYVHFYKYENSQNFSYDYQVNDQLDLVVRIVEKAEQNMIDVLNESFGKYDVPRIQRVLQLERKYIKLEQIKNDQAGSISQIQEVVHIKSKKKIKISQLLADMDNVQDQINSNKQRLSSKSLEIYKQLDKKKIKDNLLQEWEGLRGSMFFIVKGLSGFSSQDENDLKERGIYFNQDSEDKKYFYHLLTKQSQRHVRDLERLFLSRNYTTQFGGEFKGMEINNKCIVFWNYYMIWTLNLNGLMLCQKPDIIEFRVDENDDSIFINRIRSGGKGDKITIVVTESVEMENYILWDIKNSCELQSFQFELGGRAFHSDDGKVFIQGKDRVQVCDQGCALKCFQVNGKANGDINEIFPFSKGERFDSQNHNWILFEEYIGLAFSFMTLVLREKQLKNPQLEQFDPEIYNFIIN